MIKSNSNNEFTAGSVIKLCILNKKFLVLFIGTALILTLIISFIIPHEYEAQISILPPDESDKGSGMSSILQNFSSAISIGQVGQNTKVYLMSEILKSRELAKYITEKCELEKYPQFKGLKKDKIYISVRENIELQINRSGLIILTTSINTNYFPDSKDKENTAILIASIANAAAEGLDVINRKKNVSKAKTKKIFIEKVLADNKIKLDSIDNALKSFQEKNKVLAIDDQTKAIIENAVNIGSELSKAEIELSLAMQDFEPNTPKVKTFKNRVSELKNQYNKIQTGGMVKSDKFSIPLSQVPELAKQYTNLMRDQKILVQVIMYLETQKYQEAIQEESDVSTIEVLDKAYVNYDQVAPSRKLMLLIGFLLSTIIGIGIIVGKSFYPGNIYLKIKNKFEEEK